MLAEALKWLQGVGVGILAVVAQALAHVQPANLSNVFEIIAAAVLVRLAGFIVSKLPASV
jgi:hypothetical protein